MKKSKIIPAYERDVYDPANRGGGSEELKKSPLNQPGASHDAMTPPKKRKKIKKKENI